MLSSQYRIVQIGRGRVLAQPLDGVALVWLRLAAPTRFVEGEVLSVRRVETDLVTPPPAGPIPVEVLSARIDPTYLGERLPELDPEAEGEQELGPVPGLEDGEAIEVAVDLLDEGEVQAASRLLRDLQANHPLCIEAYNQLGHVEWQRKRLLRARKYYETGYRIGLGALPPRWRGTLPWSRANNRAFLQAAHGYGLALLKEQRVLEACEVFEQLLRLNPSDHQGVRHLLPEVYLRARAPDKARQCLERTGVDGLNNYTRCLLEVQAGRTSEAIRWLCEAVAYNPHVPDLLTSGRRSSRRGRGSLHQDEGSPEEAADYVRQQAIYWRRTDATRFLGSVLELEPFRRRLDRAIRIRAQLQGLRREARRSALVGELFGIFSRETIPEIVAECTHLLLA